MVWIPGTTTGAEMATSFNAIEGPLLTTGLGAEVVLDSSSFVALNPTGLGSAGAIDVGYGGAVGTVGDPVMMDANGLITINETGTYWFSFYFQFGRTTSSGTSHLVLRNLLNGFPAGSPIAAKAINASVLLPSEFHIPVGILPAGLTIQGQIMRDIDGANDGGLIPYIVQETLDNWGGGAFDAPSARIVMYRIKAV